MTEPDLLPATDHEPPQTDPGRPRAAADPADPWHGIPAELLEASRGYDTDSAGGCG